MIDKLLVSVFAWVLAVLLSVQILMAALPLFKKLEFDAVCNKYALVMDRDGGLTAAAETGILLELSERGFTVDQVSGTENAAFGDEISVYVAAHAVGYQIAQNLVMKEVTLSYTYQTNMVCRRLKSYAAGP
jgi:hypothetical protein